MEIKEIKELATIMKDTGLTALEISSEGASVKLKRMPASASVTYAQTAAVPEQSTEIKEEMSAPGLFTIKSPMVGVFYAAPGADKDPYVSVGDTVHAGDILCIIEAMKIMNEITAERDGVITEICISNKDVVEFGQPIFRMDTTQV